MTERMIEKLQYGNSFSVSQTVQKWTVCLSAETETAMLLKFT